MALWKDTSQSSNNNGDSSKYTSDIAVDGVTTTSSWDYCSVTGSTQNAWWMLDLRFRAQITGLNLFTMGIFSVHKRLSLHTISLTFHVVVYQNWNVKILHMFDYNTATMHVFHIRLDFNNKVTLFVSATLSNYRLDIYKNNGWTTLLSSITSNNIYQLFEASKLRIVHQDTGYLVLCEVQAYGGKDSIFVLQILPLILHNFQ